ncbi:MAG: antitoxin [Proteobacteria bacterium]|nr:antitoxin [Pseudomonadota bacterium]
MGHEAKLRKVGGSVMLAVPPAVLDELGVGAESIVDLAVKKGKLVVEPKRRKRYTLEELLAQCDPKASLEKDRGWVTDGPVGRELI